MMELDVTSHWSDEIEVPIGFVARWEIGPLTLYARRDRHRWALYSCYDDEREEALTRVVAPAGELDIPTAPEWARHGFKDAPSSIRLRPLLANRPIVTRPEFPFRLPAGERVVLYVSTPLWIEVRVGKARVPLADLPTWHLPDTWFGTVEDGHLCYAASTSCRQDVENVPLRPFRAVTPLAIVNASAEPVSLNRISLPVPNLRLYAADGRLWTEALTLAHEPNRGFAQARRGKGPPEEAGEAQLLTAPREALGENFVVRAFTSLFGST